MEMSEAAQKLRLMDRINKTGMESERIADDDLVQVIGFAASAEELLLLIQRAVERGKLPDIQLWRQRAKGLTTLSASIADVLNDAA